PNQMSFFIFTTLMIMLLVSRIIKIKISFIYYLIVLFLIFQTASTGMFLAIFSFVLLLLIYNIILIFRNKRFKIKTLIILNFSIISLILLSSTNIININGLINDSFILQRVEEKILKMENNYNSNSYSELTLIEERGIDKL